jgi:hypothetical protein
MKRSKRKNKRDYDEYIFTARVFKEEEEEATRVRRGYIKLLPLYI